LHVAHACRSFDGCRGPRRAPVAFNLDTGELVNAARLIDLTLDARQVGVEMGWTRLFGESQVTLRAAWSANAGNVQGRDGIGAWVPLLTRH
jgi:hypothetical protein